MSTIDDKLRKELEELKKDCSALLDPFIKYQDAKKADHLVKVPILNASRYEIWYTKALAVIRQLAPDRLADFIEHYKLSKPSKSFDVGTYTLSDALRGVTFTSMDEIQTMSVVAMHLKFAR